MFIGSVGAKPYPDELLFSYQARLRVMFAIKSPKALLRNLYDSRCISASWLYPSRLQTLSESMPTYSNITAKQLIYRHTHFPLVAPFIPRGLRAEIENAMISGNSNIAYVSSGYAANKLPKLRHPRYCPECVVDQIKEYGECFWLRTHQIMAIEVCPLHSIALCTCDDLTTGLHRHEFVPLASCGLREEPRSVVCKFNRVIGKACFALLNNENLQSPSYVQWTNYYLGLAERNNYRKGLYVDFEPIKKRIVDYWPKALMKRNNIAISDKQTSWLHTIFRKHRKSFSFLEHIIVNAAFIGDSFDIVECVNSANSQPHELRDNLKVVSSREQKSVDIETLKLRWKAILKVHSPADARSINKRLYAKLYRTDREWLVAFNRVHTKRRLQPKYRIDWHKRDVKVVRFFLLLLRKYEQDLSLPRLSSRWFMYQIHGTATIEKYIDKLPLTKAFLARYTETVYEFQIRRITHQLLSNTDPKITRRWFLLRAAGLSEQRITPITALFLKDLSNLLPTFEFQLLMKSSNTTKPY